LLAFDLKHVLEENGHEVIGPAANSQQAFSLALTCQPTMAFVDIDLECSGIGLFVARSLRENQGVAVVLTTGRPAAGRTSGAAIGMVAKPYALSDLVRTVAVVEAILSGSRPPPAMIPAALELFGSTAEVEHYAH
jgi:DNA-binding NarL/FixJ family response regulator